jgi:hypothetical protein
MCTVYAGEGGGGEGIIVLLRVEGNFGIPVFPRQTVKL